MSQLETLRRQYGGYAPLPMLLHVLALPSRYLAPSCRNTTRTVPSRHRMSNITER